MTWVLFVKILLMKICSTGDEEVQNTEENSGSYNSGHSSASGIVLYTKHVLSTDLMNLWIPFVKVMV